jgi:hypothetical protein
MVDIDAYAGERLELTASMITPFLVSVELKLFSTNRGTGR